MRFEDRPDKKVCKKGQEHDWGIECGEYYVLHKCKRCRQRMALEIGTKKETYL